MISYFIDLTDQVTKMTFCLIRLTSLVCKMIFYLIRLTDRVMKMILFLIHLIDLVTQMIFFFIDLTEQVTKIIFYFIRGMLGVGGVLRGACSVMCVSRRGWVSGVRRQESEVMSQESEVRWRACPERSRGIA